MAPQPPPQRPGHRAHGPQPQGQPSRAEQGHIESGAAFAGRQSSHEQLCHGRQREQRDIGRHRFQMLRRQIDLRLREHVLYTLFKQRRVNMLHVIAVDDAQTGQAGDLQRGAQIVQQRLRLLRQRRLFFHIDSINHAYPSNAASARCPMSRR